MAVYKIFPTKDTTLYSAYPTMNTGLDAILEVSNKLNISGDPEVARYLIQFDQTEIQNIISDKISGNSYSIYLKNFIAEAQGLNQTTSLLIHPLAQSWNNGTGYYLDNPKETDGASWTYANYNGSGPWNTSGYYSGSAGAILYTSYSGNVSGGGNWFYDTSATSYVSASYVVPFYVINSSAYTGSANATFGLRDVKDIEANVSNIVNNWLNGVIPNYGFIVKLSGSQEFNPSQYVQPIFKFYSVDTNTIYPPCLEFRWRDYTSVITPSSPVVTTTDLKMSLAENPGTFFPESKNRFYINVSPLYPTRTYQTASLFTNLNYLPTSSYYAIKDLATNEFVVNFDNNYTQISSDSKGNYFDVYMSGLEPERYYKVIIKTELNGSTILFDDNYYFKVING
jgi:hypothetical protein